MRARATTVAVALALLAAGGCGSGGAGADPPGQAGLFLDSYAQSDGRVVRRDQGGDTVSEGQAYAMLISAATGDRERFARIWGWTRAHLQRRDGLLSWRWADGHVVDAQPAADADLDAARALLVASERFDRPAYRAAALWIGRGVLASETARAGGQRVLVAGPWARPQAIVNPSYFAPRTFAMLGEASGDPRWKQLVRSSMRIVASLQDHASGLAPDWARAVPGGAVPIGTPDDPSAQARHGYDAMRLPLRLAETCSRQARAQAAAPWRTLGAEKAAGRIAPVHDLGGAPLAGGEHPAALAGAAASAAAAGDEDAADELLGTARRLAAREPSYYGAAWAALAPIMLRSHRLHGCPAL